MPFDKWSFLAHVSGHIWLQRRCAPSKSAFAGVGNSQDEQRIKEATSATLRCIPFKQPEDLPKPCLLTGSDAAEVAIFAKAY